MTATSHNNNEMIKGGKGARKKNMGIQQNKKEDSTTWIIFMNIGGLPTFYQYYKNTEIHTLVRAHEVYILGLAEININWT